MDQAPPGPPHEGGPNGAGNDGRRRLVGLSASALLGVVGATAVAVGFGFGHATPPAPDSISAAAANALEAAARSAQAGLGAYAPLAPLPLDGFGRATPTQLIISRVGIDTSIMELGLAPDGTLEVPPDVRDGPAGWYRGLASPGEVGPAVIVGHLDAPDAPAVFYNLGALRTGDTARIVRADGSVAAFRVREVGTYPRENFPTNAVYGPSPTSVLRLVTCGGAYERGVGYSHNVVVFADLIGASSAPEPAGETVQEGGAQPVPEPQPVPDSTQTIPGPPPRPDGSTDPLVVS